MIEVHPVNTIVCDTCQRVGVIVVIARILPISKLGREILIIRVSVTVIEAIEPQGVVPQQPGHNIHFAVCVTKVTNSWRIWDKYQLIPVLISYRH